MNILGIDPGKKGGLALLNRDAEVIELSVMQNQPVDLFDLLLDWKDRHSISRVYLENVTANACMSRLSSFSFGKSVGHIEGVVKVLKLPLKLVTPKSWTCILHEGVYGDSPKVKSLKVVKSLYPTLELTASPKSRRAHDGLVDAILIARYGLTDLLK